MYNYASIGFFTITICHCATQHPLWQDQWELQEWADRNPMKVSKCKSQAVPWEGQGPCHGTAWGKRGLGVVMGSDLDTSLWHVLGQRQPAKSWLHEQGHSHRLGKGIVLLYMVLPRAQLEMVSSLGPQHSRNLEKWGELEGALSGG